MTEELVAPKSLKEIKMAFEINEKKFSNLRQRKEKCSQLQLVYESSKKPTQENQNINER